jgi:dolichyl-phosphate beta-glucosyltransferase
MPDVCLVVPCFNEAARLKSADFLAYLAADTRVSFCFVNDGSTDKTAAVLAELATSQPDRILTLSLAQNAGKAEAVRRGCLHAAGVRRFDFVGYWDADLATPLSELGPMLETLERFPSCQLVLGSRWRRLGSNITRRTARHALGRVFATAASLVLDLPVYDSQCGAKVFRSAVIDALFNEPFMTRWLFDVELLARLKNHSGAAISKAVIEVPLTHWHDVGGSRLGPAEMLTVPVGLFRIHRHYRLR